MNTNTEFLTKLLDEGTRVIVDDYFKLEYEGKRYSEAKVVYLLANPDDDLKGYDIHHKDFNRYNNSPENLVKMVPEAHLRLHRRKEFLEAISKISKSNKDDILEALMLGCPFTTIVSKYGITRREINGILLYHGRSIQLEGAA